jgi:hypothetical protein
MSADPERRGTAVGAAIACAGALMGVALTAIGVLVAVFSVVAVPIGLLAGDSLKNAAIGLLAGIGAVVLGLGWIAWSRRLYVRPRIGFREVAISTGLTLATMPAAMVPWTLARLVGYAAVGTFGFIVVAMAPVWLAARTRPSETGT